MQFDRTRVFDGQEITARKSSDQKQPRQSAGKLRAVAALMLTMASCMPSGLAAQTPAGTKGPDKAASDLPAAPVPVEIPDERIKLPPAMSVVADWPPPAATVRLLPAPEVARSTQICREAAPPNDRNECSQMTQEDHALSPEKLAQLNRYAHLTRYL